MRRSWIIGMGLAATGTAAVLLFVRPGGGPRAALQETRETLQARGFKTALGDFDFTTSPADRARTAALTNAMAITRASADPEQSRRLAMLQGQPQLRTAVSPESAIVAWRLDRLETYSDADGWPILREVMTANRSVLEPACDAALSGPIRFHLDSTAGHRMLLPHLAALKQLAQMLSRRAVLELHDGHGPAAWTNLLAATRLVTAYEPRPLEIAQLVRCACAGVLYEATWQVLQADGWNDEQLAQLQREWESVDYFKDWPETAAFGRAAAVDTCQLQRQTPLSPGVKLTDLIRSFRSAWSRFSNYRRELAYRRGGSYEDEAALLLHYRDRELELRRAIQSPTWFEMRGLPGVTNLVAFQSTHPSPLQAMLNLKYLNMGFHSRGKGMLGSAAEAEARRRLLLTAIAVERHRVRHGSYPPRLDDLEPGLLDGTPVDFMDGQPLRYRLTGDGRFVLYSVGLDCVDNGGRMPVADQGDLRFTDSGEAILFRWQGADLVWPRPASAMDFEAAEDRKAQALLERVVRAREIQVAQRVRTLARLEQIHAAQQPRDAEGPTFRGRSLAQALGGAASPGLTLDQLLTLQRIDKGADPAIATFEVPVAYEALTGIGQLSLLVDTLPEESGVLNMGGGHVQICERATNGNCLLTWNTDYDFPGRHFIQARLEYHADDESGWGEVRGPLVPFHSSNVCQVDLRFSEVDSSRAILHASLPDLNSDYAVELLALDGAHLKTFKGTTTNGVIQIRWDRIDDRGRRYTNESFQVRCDLARPDPERTPEPILP